MSQKSYVHDGKEVVLTGRTAQKQLPSGKVRTLYEIKPSGGPAGNQYNKWVEMKDLFEIVEDKSE